MQIAANKIPFREAGKKAAASRKKSARCRIASCLLAIPLISCAAVAVNTKAGQPGVAKDNLVTEPKKTSVAPGRMPETPCRTGIAMRELEQGESAVGSQCDQKHVFMLTDRKRLVTVFLGAGGISEDDPGFIRISHTASTVLDDILETGREPWSCTIDEFCYFLGKDRLVRIDLVSTRAESEGGDTRFVTLGVEASHVKRISVLDGHVFLSPVFDGGREAMAVVSFDAGKAGLFVGKIEEPEKWIKEKK